MFFSLSKIFWFVADPGNSLLILLIIGVLLLWTPWRRPARWLLTLTALAALFFAVVPVGTWMIAKLENRIPPPSSLPQKVDGIIVLGGVINQFVSRDRKQTAINGAAERLTEFIRLAKTYPEAKLVFTGGSGSLTDQSVKEAPFVKPFLASFGVDPARVVFEDQSRNTAENATLTRELMKPRPGELWIMVTSAFHMPRALGVFRKAGWQVVPYPVDYKTGAPSSLSLGFNLRGGINSFAGGLHEWLGLTFYWLSGRTNEFFPQQ